MRNKNWRPPDWKRPWRFVRTPSLIDLVRAQDTAAVKYYQNESFEAGADAMFEPAYQRGRQAEREALRAEGQHFNLDKKIITVKVPNVFRSKFKGCFVFIPDDEVNA